MTNASDWFWKASGIRFSIQYSTSLENESQPWRSSTALEREIFRGLAIVLGENVSDYQERFAKKVVFTSSRQEDE